jgi:hypothetical protein
VVYFLHGFQGELQRDQAMYIYAGQRLAEGAAPYVDMFERTGPLAQLIPGIGVLAARAAGVDDVIGVRVLFAGLAAASISLMYVLARDLFRSRAAGFASAAALLCFEGFVFFASTGPSEKTVMVLFLLAMLIAVHRRAWMATGVLVSLATLTWQPAFLPAMACIVAATIAGAGRGRRLPVLGRVVLGGLIPTALAIGAYVAMGHLGTLLDGFLLVNLRYRAPNVFLADIAWRWGALLNWYGVSLSVLIVGLVAVLFAAARSFVRGRGVHPNPAATLFGVGVLTLVGIAWSIWEFDNGPDIFMLLPSGALGIGALFSALEVRHAVVGVTAGVVAMATIAVTFAIGLRPDGLGAAAHPEGLRVQREAVVAVLDALPGDEAIFSVEAPQPLVFSGKRNASRFQLYGSGLDDYVDDTWPGGIEGYVTWIEGNEPSIVAIGRDRIPDWLAAALDNRYQRVGSAPGWTWYVRKDLGSDRIQPIRAAIREWQHEFRVQLIG